MTKTVHVAHCAIRAMRTFSLLKLPDARELNIHTATLSGLRKTFTLQARLRGEWRRLNRVRLR